MCICCQYCFSYCCLIGLKLVPCNAHLSFVFLYCFQAWGLKCATVFVFCASYCFSAWGLKCAAVVNFLFFVLFSGLRPEMRNCRHVCCFSNCFQAWGLKCATVVILWFFVLFSGLGPRTMRFIAFPYFCLFCERIGLDPPPPLPPLSRSESLEKKVALLIAWVRDHWLHTVLLDWLLYSLVGLVLVPLLVSYLLTCLFDYWSRGWSLICWLIASLLD